MRIAVELAGFTLGGADLLRKAMGKKDRETMKAQKQKFVQGARKKGVAAAKADKIFEQIKEFAEYGFNKSHAAVYALVAYQTAWLKAHYPVHYLAALLTSEAERGATPQVAKYIGECHEMGIQVLPPDINKSEYRFTVEGGDIRFGLAAVKGIGQGAVEELVAARKRAGAFASPFDLFLEHDTKVLNRKAVESLIKAGAFDSLGWKRSQCYHMLDRMIEFGHDVQKAQASRQTFLFGAAATEPPPMPQEVQEMREWDESHVLSYEMDALGLYITGHPLARHKDRLRKLVSHMIDELDSERDFDKDVRLAGLVGSLKPLKTKKDERMATFVLEDLTGKIEVVAFPDCFSRFGQHLREGQPVWIKGKYMGDEDNRRISLSAAMPLAEAFEKQAKRVVVRIFLPGLEEATIAELKSVLDGYEGRCPVEFELETPHSYRVVAQSAEVQKVTPSEELIQKLVSLLGENSVTVEY